MIPKELETTFVKWGDTFTLLAYRPETKTYLYKRSSPGGSVYYEVFKRKVNTRFNCVSYPGDEAFGKWAKCCSTYEDAKRYVDVGL